MMGGTPRRSNGKAIDYMRTPFREAVRDGMFDDGVYALLRKRGGRWRVVIHEIGAMDYSAPDWVRRFGAPRAIIP